MEAGVEGEILLGRSELGKGMNVRQNQHQHSVDNLALARIIRQHRPMTFRGLGLLVGTPLGEFQYWHCIGIIRMAGGKGKFSIFVISLQTYTDFINEE